jgi:hypothetical protein
VVPCGLLPGSQGRECEWRVGGAGVWVDGAGVGGCSRNGGRRPDLLGIEPIRLPGSPYLPSAEPPRTSGPDKAPEERWVRGCPTDRAQPLPRPPRRRLDGAYPCAASPLRAADHGSIMVQRGMGGSGGCWCGCGRFHKTAAYGRDSCVACAVRRAGWEERGERTPERRETLCRASDNRVGAGREGAGGKAHRRGQGDESWCRAA